MAGMTHDRLFTLGLRPKQMKCSHDARHRHQCRASSAENRTDGISGGGEITAFNLNISNKNLILNYFLCNLQFSGVFINSFFSL